VKKKTTELWDMHCHVLYGVDDGSKDVDMTKRMLDVYHKEGIENIIVTPHFNPGVWHKDKAALTERFEEVKKMVSEMYPEITLYLGSELFYDASSSPSDMDNKNIPTLAGSRYILMEFMTGISWKDMKHAVDTATTYDYIPVIAHVERFETLVGHIDRILELKDIGAYIQVNAGSIMGKTGLGIKLFTGKLLKHRLVDFVATDAHRDEGRSPKLRDCAEYIASKYGADYAEDIFVNHPKKVVSDEYLD
jgi:protein-tyrosine phosphatase